MMGGGSGSLNEIVGTTNRSMAAMPSAWLRSNVFHPWEGGLFHRLIKLMALDVDFRLAVNPRPEKSSDCAPN